MENTDSDANYITTSSYKRATKTLASPVCFGTGSVIARPFGTGGANTSPSDEVIREMKKRGLAGDKKK